MDIEQKFFAEGEEHQRELARLIAGDFSGTPTTWGADADGAQTIDVSVRDAYLARAAARSRLPARGAARDTSAVTDLGDEDDDEAVSFPGMTARGAHEQREVARSRRPAGGAR